MYLNDKQKKVMLIFTIIIFTLLTIVSTYLFIYGYFIKDNVLQLIGMISSFLSPSMLLGIAIKLVLNKVHMKQIDNKFQEVGITLSKTEEREIVKETEKAFRYKDFLFYEKEGKIIVKYDDKIPRTPEQMYEDIREAFFKFINKKRRDALK